MLPGLIVTLVAFCWRHARGVVTLSLLLTLALGFYAATHIALDTDESHLIAADLPFRQQERKMDAAFPQDVDLLVAVIDGPSSEEAERAVNQLVNRLAGQSDLFRSLRRPPEDLFFRRHGLLFLSIDELTDLSDRLVAAQPLLGSLARDPSLRGLLGSVNLALEAAAHGQMDLRELKPLLDKLDKAALAATGQGPIAAMSWASLFGPMAEHDAPTRVLLAQPVLQFGELVAGRQASDAIRQAAVELGLTKENGFRLRLTGPVALTDANFATVTEGMSLTGPLMLLAICLLLFLAVRSLRITLAILFSLIVGLVATAAFAAATIGSLNPISIAFAVMFVGIAVDFAIQFIVRYRDERLRFEDGRVAMHSAAKAMAAPLSLAALATAVGFLSFLPTDYTGVSQLGLIAGGGMIIALVVDFTLLPATIALIQPRPEKESYGLPLAAFDRWLTTHAGKVLIAASGLALAGAAALPWLPLDFNPLHLQNPKSEAVATFLDLARDPDNGSYGVQLLVPSRDAAQGLLAQFDRMPEVSRTMWLGSLIPDQQEDKRAILDDLDHLLGPALHPSEHLAAPSPDQLRAVLIQTAGSGTGASDRLRILSRSSSADRRGRGSSIAA